MTRIAARAPGRPAASTREAALALATDRFIAGERVDMRAILAEERLLAIRQEVGGRGGPALLNTFDRFNREIAASRGMNVLLAREHERALRILTSSAGVVQPRVVAGIDRLIGTEVEAGHFVSPFP